MQGRCAWFAEGALVAADPRRRVGGQRGVASLAPFAHLKRHLGSVRVTTRCLVLSDRQFSGGPERQQQLAAELGFSETVFVDDPGLGVVDIYTPSVRLPFAGFPLVGTAWLLREYVHAVDVLRPPAGEVPVAFEDGLTWIQGRAEWASGKRTQQFGSPAEVDALPAPPSGEGWPLRLGLRGRALGPCPRPGFSQAW